MVGTPYFSIPTRVKCVQQIEKIALKDGNRSGTWGFGLSDVKAYCFHDALRL